MKTIKRHHFPRAARWPTGRQFALLFSLITALIFTLQTFEQMQFLREASAKATFAGAGYDWNAGHLVGLIFWLMPVWVYACATIGSRATAKTPLAVACFLANVVLLVTWGTGMVTAYRVANGH